MSATLRCRRHYCGGPVELLTDGNGRVVATCVRCEPCAMQRHRALGRERDRERYPTRRHLVLAHHRQRTAIPEIREHRRQYMAEYRQANPRDAFDRAYQRVYMQQRRADPTYRARQNARKRALRHLARERAA